MYRKWILIIVLISIVLQNSYVCSNAVAADLTLVQLARMSVKNYLETKDFNNNDINLLNKYTNKIEGVFVSIIGKNNKSRGCWGTLHQQSDIKEAIIAAAVGSVKQDYRFKPLSLYELSEVKFQVSLVLRVIPINSIREINPLRDGLLVQSGSKSGILMPGEATDAYYQMVQCKLKANIQPGEAYNLFKLVTKVYKE